MIKVTSRNILFIGTIFASILAFSANWIISREAALEEKVQFEKIAENIQLKLKAFEHVSQGIHGLMHLNDGDVSPEKFRTYAQTLNFFNASDGALGFGFIRKVEARELKKYLDERKLRDPRFRDHYLGHKDHADHFFIELVEPYERNRTALGLDIGSEASRRDAAERAALTGLPALTRKIQLVQSNKQEAGFLYFYPVYRTNQTPEVNRRKEDLVGFTYAPILASHLASIPNSDQFHIRIYQDNDQNSENLLFENESGHAFKPARRTSITMGGVEWLLEAEARNVGILDHSRSIIVLMTFMIAFLVVYVLLSRWKKSADDKIKEHREFLQKVINDIPSMIGYWDHELINRLSNNSYRQYFGKKVEEIYGRHISELLGQELYQKNLPFLLEALKGNEQTFERVIPLPTGGQKHTLAQYIPDTVDGVVKGIIVIVTDITDLKKMEEERHLLQARMMYSSKMATLGEMASGLAHEINNPLTIILGKIQMLKDHVLDPDKVSMSLQGLEKIETTAGRISVIIQGLSYFTEEKQNTFTEREELNVVIEKTLSFCAERFLNHGILLEVDCPSDVYIDCVPTEISQMLLNLLNNAHDAVENLNSKWVRLQVKVIKDQVEISVTDSGKGIPAQFHEKIMEPFFTTKGPQRGSGLGLSISLGIAKKHLGTLIYDHESANTRFTFTMPISQ